HIGLREAASAALAATEAALDLLEERGVEVDLLVGRAIERPHRALRNAAAGGISLTAEEHERRRPIALAVLAEHVLPDRLGAAEHARHEAAAVVTWRAGLARPGLRRRRLGLGLPVDHLGAADEQARIDAERPTDQAEHQHGADAKAAGAAHGKAAT